MLTNSIMTHHDAITGTHMTKVGQDYQIMMQNSAQKALGNTDMGVLAESLRKLAQSQGIKVKDFQLCTLDGNVVLCNEILKAEGDSTVRSLITVQNPELKSQHGFFLRVPKTLPKLAVSVIEDGQEPD